MVKAEYPSPRSEQGEGGPNILAGQGMLPEKEAFFLPEMTGEIGDPGQLPPLALAYIGDAVYELMVRRYYLYAGVLKAKRLHQLTVGQVCAARQGALAQEILGALNEEELSVYKRGRNAKSGHHPAGTAVTDYRRATGLEALIGYLYLARKGERLQWLMEQVFSSNPQGMVSQNPQR